MKKLILISLTFVLTLLLIIKNNVYASDDNDLKLFNDTNTYNVKEINNKVIYDMNSKNSNKVSQDLPQVTFLIHGLGGSAGDWSNSLNYSKEYELEYKNNFNLVCDTIDIYDDKKQINNKSYINENDSLVGYLSQKASSNIYVAKIIENKVRIINMTNSIFNSDDTYKLLDKKSYELSHIIDNTKHSIVLFESNDSTKPNDYVYNEFNKVASYILNDLKNLDRNNELPKINLIGHSRGGLTALEYALDHPDLVDSLFTIGTPFLGSSSAKANEKFHFVKDDYDGYNDILDEKIYKSYYNRWNDNYDELYKNIKVNTIGSYQSLLMFVYEYFYEFLGDDFRDALLSVERLYKTMDFLNINHNKFKNRCLNLLISVLDKMIDKEYSNSILAFLSDLDFTNMELESDILVDLDSQIGVGFDIKGNYYKYKGFNNYKRHFKLDGSFDLNKISQDFVPVTHNLECRDSKIIKYITKNIRLNNSKNSSYIINRIDDTRCEILSYIGIDRDNLIIPDYINDNGTNLLVYSISDYAFSESKINSVEIPNSVNIIGDYAFSNIGLNSVEFKNDSNLYTIGEFSFSDNNIKNFKINKNLLHIGLGAFFNNEISNFEIDNEKYSYDDGLLIENNGGMCEAIYAKKRHFKFKYR